MSGPAVEWEVRPDHRDPNAWDVYEGSLRIARLPWQSEANAHQIAAARQMKAALDRLRPLVAEVAASVVCPKDNLWSRALSAVDAAIAKAEGRQ